MRNVLPTRWLWICAICALISATSRTASVASPSISLAGVSANALSLAYTALTVRRVPTQGRYLLERYVVELFPGKRASLVAFLPEDTRSYFFFTVTGQHATPAQTDRIPDSSLAHPVVVPGVIAGEVIKVLAYAKSSNIPRFHRTMLESGKYHVDIGLYGGASYISLVPDAPPAWARTCIAGNCEAALIYSVSLHDGLYVIRAHGIE